MQSVKMMHNISREAEAALFHRLVLLYVRSALLCAVLICYGEL